jgi:membrane fusion protein, multidrug efflux system
VKTRRLLLLAASAAVLGGCSRHERPVAAEALPTVRVETAAVQVESRPVLLETSGTVRAVQRATIAAKVSGTIATLPAKLGQRVNAGDVLLTISAAELTARVAQARAQLAQVERELARERTLQSSGAGTVDAVKSLEDRLALSQAALREADTMFGYATVRAPFAGVVAKKYVEAGDFASPGDSLLQLDGLDAFEIEVGVPESLAASLGVGGTLEVALADSATRFRATIAELSSAADATARTTTAKLGVPRGTAVRAGQFVRVFVPGTSATGLFVPTNAVSIFGQMERVFVVGEKDRASLRLVKTGAIVGDRTEIVSGLDATERVVVAPPALLRDGQPLEFAP